MDAITNIYQFINRNKKTSYNLKNFYDTIFVAENPNEHIFKIPIDDFFLKYKDALKGIEKSYYVDQTYFYKPKMLSMVLYDTTEFWLALLRINGMKNVTEFNRSIIKIYDETLIKELLNIFLKREGKK